MSRLYSLSYYTVAPIDPLEQIELAARTGYNLVGLRPAQPRPDAPVQALSANPELVRATRKHARDAGIGVLDIEFMWLDAGFQPHRCAGLAEVGHELDAKTILVGALDSDRGRLVQTFAELCDVARAAGLGVDMEITPFTAIDTIESALALIDEAGAPVNAGILIDTLHVSRIGARPDDLRSIPRGRLRSVQLSDADDPKGITAEQIGLSARSGRLPPGEGRIELGALLGALPADLPLALEVPNLVRMGESGQEAWCRLVLTAGRRVAEALTLSA